MRKLSEIQEEVVDFGFTKPERQSIMDKVTFFFASRVVLKPCPFCANGHAAAYVERIAHQPSDFRPNGGVTYSTEIGCTACRATVRYIDDSYEVAFVKVIDRWQTRNGSNSTPTLGQDVWNHIHDPSTPLLLPP